MSRDLSLALATASLPILGLLAARWNETRAAIAHHPFNVLRLAVAIVCLTVSMVGGVVVAGDAQSDPSDLFIFIQMIGVAWGAVNFAYPLLLDLAGDLEATMPERSWRLLSAGLSVLVVVAAVAVVFIATAWWYALAALVVAVAGLALWAKVGPAIGRLLGPDDRG